jgi:hypothetical protein
MLPAPYAPLALSCPQESAADAGLFPLCSLLGSRHSTDVAIKDEYSPQTRVEPTWAGWLFIANNITKLQLETTITSVRGDKRKCPAAE